MITFTLRRVLSAEKTEAFIEFEGKEYDKNRNSSRFGLHQISRLLTGATDEKDLDSGKADIGGIFNRSYSIQCYGSASKRFEWATTPLDLQNDPPAQIAETIVARVRAVREWIASIRQDESHTITLDIDKA